MYAGTRLGLGRTPASTVVCTSLAPYIACQSALKQVRQGSSLRYARHGQLGELERIDVNPERWTDIDMP